MHPGAGGRGVNWFKPGHARFDPPITRHAMSDVNQIATPENINSPRVAARPGLIFRVLDSIWNTVNRVLADRADRFIPDHCANDPESGRRARLICRFGFLGAIFGVVYAVFYLLIGHFWGGAIIGVCCALFGLVPSLLRSGVTTWRAGNHYCLILFLLLKYLHLLNRVFRQIMLD